MEIAGLDKRTNVDEHIRYLEDQAYTALLNYGEPIRSGEILSLIDNPKYSARLIKHVLSSSPRFAQIDRRWDLEARYEDKQRTVERVINEIISMYGRPMPIRWIAQEVSNVFGKPPEYYEQMLDRILRNTDRYFSTSSGEYGHSDWLLIIASEDEEDIIFDNDINTESLDRIQSQIGDFDLASGSYLDAMKQVADQIGSSIDNKIISFLFWRARGSEFDPVAMFDELYSSPDFIWMSDHSWISRENALKYDDLLAKMADSLVEEMPEENVLTQTQVAETEEESTPTLTLNVSERDLDEIAEIIQSKGVAYLPSIIETIFEISPRDQIYQIAAEGLSEAMRADRRFAWLGTDRWTMAESVPEFVHTIPDEFAIPKFDFETPEGEKIDIELEDEGLEGDLAIEINNPLVLDVYDSETSMPLPEDAEKTQMVLTYRHKKTGVYPLCRMPQKFFPTGSPIMQLTFVVDEKPYETWVSRETGLIYEIDRWYPQDMPESGAVFEIEKTEKPDVFNVTYINEPHPDLAIAPARLEDLLSLAENAKEGNLSTYDILCQIMRYHRKGIAFVPLFTELNIVRRTTRRMAASILSSYYAFYQRPKSNLWQFDEKKEDQGFKKAKRKYVRR